MFITPPPPLPENEAKTKKLAMETQHDNRSAKSMRLKFTHHEEITICSEDRKNKVSEALL